MMSANSVSYTSSWAILLTKSKLPIYQFREIGESSQLTQDNWDFSDSLTRWDLWENLMQYCFLRARKVRMTGNSRLDFLRNLRSEAITHFLHKTKLLWHTALISRRSMPYFFPIKTARDKIYWQGTVAVCFGWVFFWCTKSSSAGFRVYFHHTNIWQMSSPRKYA